MGREGGGEKREGRREGRGDSPLTDTHMPIFSRVLAAMKHGRYTKALVKALSEHTTACTSPKLSELALITGVGVGAALIREQLLIEITGVVKRMRNEET